MPTVQTYSGAVYPTSGQAYSGVVYVNGEWNASTNIPSLASSVGIENYAYRVSVAGSTSLNGVSDWNVDDFIIFSNGAWRKLTGKEVDVSALSGGGTGVLTALANPVNSANGVVTQNASGNVGIGTGSPESKVHARASDNFVQITAEYNGLGVAGINFKNSGSSTGYIYYDNGANMLFYTANSERVRIDGSGNLLVGMSTAAASAQKTLHLANATAPTGNPSGGGVLYVENGALKYRGSSGTVTTIANA